ncbi:unnamed protein product [Ectocarpus sp. CCAP 1310/34]|nr:unnamed protein product [Ectocarpus sp. CCAP 1310/34]
MSSSPWKPLLGDVLRVWMICGMCWTNAFFIQKLAAAWDTQDKSSGIVFAVLACPTARPTERIHSSL